MKTGTAKVCAGVLFAAAGVWLILHGHPGGGWMVLGGFLLVGNAL